MTAQPRFLRWGSVLLVRAVLSIGGIGVLLLAAWIGSRSVYHSWHPCDWLLQDTVDRVLARQGIDPDSASIPLKAVTSESVAVSTVLELRNTPLQCLSTWAVARISP